MVIKALLHLIEKGSKKQVAYIFPSKDSHGAQLTVL
jgi:hypothetical protein